MNIVQCSKSSDHWFDRDLNQHCPLCGALALGETGVGKIIPSIQPSTIPQSKYGGDEKTEDFWNVSTSTPVSRSDATVDNSQRGQGPGPAAYHDFSMNSQPPAKEEPQFDPAQNASHVLYGPPPTLIETLSEAELPDTEALVPPASSLQETVQASVADSGKTMGYFEEMMVSVTGQAGTASSSQGSEEGVYSSDKQNASPSPIYMPTTPVVGWLVAVSGPHFGQSFPLTDGRNSIGRESENQVILSRDKTVSRIRQALLIYDPLHSQFYVQPGSESSQLAYLNGKMLKGIEDLKEKDIVMVGKTKLLFVPLCGENFSWEDYIGEK